MIRVLLFDVAILLMQVDEPAPCVTPMYAFEEQSVVKDVVSARYDPVAKTFTYVRPVPGRVFCSGFDKS